jgi:S1-C subfamily serine protease
MYNTRRILLALILVIICTSMPVFAGTIEIVKANSTKVIMILTYDANGQPLAIGSGFFISNDGQIATNFHVLEGATKAIVKAIESEDKFAVENAIYIDPAYDLAIIKIEKVTEAVILGDDESLPVGERIVAIGNPEGLEGSVSEGIVSGFRSIDKDHRVIQITAPISPGSSGGPVFDSKGQVIGIASASLISGQNLNFAIPVAGVSSPVK